MSERGPEPGGAPSGNRDPGPIGSVGFGYPQPSGPTFDPYQPIGVQPPPAPAPGPSRPPRRRGPTLITLGVLILAAALIVTGALIANRRDQHAAPSSSAPSAVSTPAVGPSDAGDTATSAPFSTAGGSGTLRMLDHRWTTAGDPAPSYGAYLEVEVELSVDHGAVGYGPTQFSAFDADSQSFYASETVTRQPELGSGVLSAGQSVRGWVIFDIDRSRTLVMMAGRDSQPIAALKVEG